MLCSPSGKPMKRELDLIDVWFDSGAMPYAQNHYPFENQDAPRTADFISEGVDQTRGWFFTLHAIHTMIEGSVAYKNVISNGLVLDKNGNKMSKRLGNAVLTNHFDQSQTLLLQLFVHSVVRQYIYNRNLRQYVLLRAF